MMSQCVGTSSEQRVSEFAKVRCIKCESYFRIIFHILYIALSHFVNSLHCHNELTEGFRASTLDNTTAIVVNFFGKPKFIRAFLNVSTRL